MAAQEAAGPGWRDVRKGGRMDRKFATAAGRCQRSAVVRSVGERRAVKKMPNVVVLVQALGAAGCWSCTNARLI